MLESIVIYANRKGTHSLHSIDESPKWCDMHCNVSKGYSLRWWMSCSEVERGTEVTLRVSYRLPENLRSYVGPVGVWGDVNDILQENLVCMKVRIAHLTSILRCTTPVIRWSCRLCQEKSGWQTRLEHGSVTFKHLLSVAGLCRRSRPG